MKTKYTIIFSTREHNTMRTNQNLFVPTTNYVPTNTIKCIFAEKKITKILFKRE